MNDATFETHVRQLFRQITSGGVDQLNQEGFRVRCGDDLRKLSRKGMRLFIRGCHYSFNAAQKQIARLVVEIVGEKTAIKELIKKAEVASDTDQVDHLEASLRHLERQIILLRRLLDCVLAHFIGSQGWILRQLMLYEEIHDIDPNVLQKTVKEADRRNRQDRMIFHLVTDLLTAVHVGDLIKVDRSDITKPMQPAQWEVIELKEGKINETLGALLEKQADRPFSPEDLRKVEDQLGHKSVKQIERMIRQRTRQERVDELIRTDKGLEPISGDPMLLRDTDGDYSDYFHIVRSICDRLTKGEEIASGVYQGCLYIAGVTHRTLQRSGFTGIVHRFFHMRNPERRCMLGSDQNTADQEFAEMSALSAGVIDLVDVNLRSGWSRSTFNWPMDEETIFKLAFREYRIFVSIDYARLFTRAAKEKGIMIEWVPSNMKGIKGDTRDFLTRHSHPIVGSPNARGVWITRENEPKQLLMAGFFNRLFVELMTPEYWLNLMERHFEIHHFTA